MSREGYVSEQFPEVDPGVVPFGTRVMVQLRTVKTKTSGGIVLVEETREFNKENSVLGKVVALGPLAYRNRETSEQWPEGVWCSIGDIVMIPKWGGLRFDRPIEGRDDKAKFAIMQDHEIICGVRSGFEDLDKIL